jgi:hypothetical protein
MKSFPSLVRQTRTSNISTNDDLMLRSSIEEVPVRSSVAAETNSKSHSSSMFTLNQRPVYRNCSNQRLKKTSSVEANRLTKPSTNHSHRSLNDDNNNKEQIWIKRRLSNTAIEKLFDRRKSFLWKEIIDVTV